MITEYITQSANFSRWHINAPNHYHPDLPACVVVECYHPERGQARVSSFVEAPDRARSRHEEATWCDAIEGAAAYAADLLTSGRHALEMLLEIVPAPVAPREPPDTTIHGGAGGGGGGVGMQCRTTGVTRCVVTGRGTGILERVAISC